MGKSILLIIFLFTASFGLAQETGSIKGHITDAELNDEPLLFAKVSLKNTDYTTETNFHGNFEINDIEAGEYILMISYLGYQTTEIPVSIKDNTATLIDSNLKALEIDLASILDNDTASSALEEEALTHSVE